MALTPARQRNAVSQGIALGLLIHGYDRFDSHKFNTDLSFVHAWRSWNYRDRYSQVNTDLRNGYGGLRGTLVMTSASEKKHVFLYWERMKSMYHIRWKDPDWSPKDSHDLKYAIQCIDEETPLKAWKELAHNFLRLSNPEPQ